MKTIIHWFISALAIIITAFLLPGVTISGIATALILALVLGFINAILKPVLLILTLPINILTLGLFTFIINALLILLASRIVPSFQISGFFTAFLFAIILSIINSLLNKIIKKRID